MSYATIMADPPWPYSSRDLKAAPLHRPNTWDGPTGGIDASARYGLMGVAEIASLPVASLAAPNAHLYLWATNSFMVEAHDVARAWGFTTKTIITWVKHKRGVESDDLVDAGSDAASMKMGYWFRSATEHCLFCVRGSLRLKDKICLPTWFGHGRERHSKKPEAFRAMVERASPGPYLEVFARAAAPGWDGWGNEHPAPVSLAPPEASR